MLILGHAVNINKTEIFIHAVVKCLNAVEFRNLLELQTTGNYPHGNIYFQI